MKPEHMSDTKTERGEKGQGGRFCACMVMLVDGWSKSRMDINGVVLRHGSPVMVTVMFCTS